MAVLNLRNVPDDLMRDLKKAALDAGQPFHAFCIQILSGGLDDSGIRAAWQRERRLPATIETRADTLLRGGQRGGGLCDLPPAHAPQVSDMAFAPGSGRPERRGSSSSAVKVDIT